MAIADFMWKNDGGGINPKNEARLEQTGDRLSTPTSLDTECLANPSIVSILCYIYQIVENVHNPLRSCDIRKGRCIALHFIKTSNRYVTVFAFYGVYFQTPLNFNMILSSIFVFGCTLFLSQATAFNETHSIWSHEQHQSDRVILESRLDGGSPRNVYAVADIAIKDRAESPKTGKTLLYGHAFLHIEGTPQDGALRMEHVQPRPYAIGIRVRDYTVQNNDKTTLAAKVTKSTVRRIYLVGQTTMTNAEFADPSTGKGLVLDVWRANPVWAQGSNCCNQFVQNLVAKLNLKTPKPFNTYVANAEEYAAVKLPPFSKTDLPLYMDKVTQWGEEDGNEETVFDTTDLESPKLVTPEAPADESNYLADTSAAPEGGPKLALAPPGAAAPEPPSPFASLDIVFDSSSEAASGDDDSPSEPESGSAESKSSVNVNADKPQAISSVRIGGVASDLTVVLEDAAKAAGIAGVAVAPLFVILDFAQGNPVGGAFGAVGLFLTALAVTAAEGPVGWLVGGLAALFSILPSFFSKPASAFPSINNTTEILQYAMFGDINHTGNEKCREQNPNCTALYGPGVIGTSLKWDNFDPIAFLLQYNEGYAMSLPEIAAAFYIVDPSKPGDGADRIATITCQQQRSGCTRFSCPGADRGICGKASFKLNLPLITLPVLNQTADKIFDRIIPKPHGDCKLINDMSETHYTDYNITVTGSPSAIACGVTASIQNTTSTPPPINSSQPLHNTTSPYYRNTTTKVSLIKDPSAYNGLQAAFHSPANMSTDGSIHEVAAPSPTGFVPNALNSTNAICLAGSGGSMCFPNGTYAIQTGTFGFDSSKVNSLSLPANGILSFTVPAKGKPHQALRLQTLTYKTNQPSSDRTFGNNFNLIAATAFGPRTFNVQVPDGPPVVCLFSQPQYAGDMTCYGAGTGNVSANAVDVAQSLTLHGNANVWIYGNYYGDDGGAKVTVDTADLTTIPLGVNDNFNKKIKALWVTG